MGLITSLLHWIHPEVIQGNIWLNNVDIFTHRKPQQAALRQEARKERLRKTSREI